MAMVNGAPVRKMLLIAVGERERDQYQANDETYKSMPTRFLLCNSRQGKTGSHGPSRRVAYHDHAKTVIHRTTVRTRNAMIRGDDHENCMPPSSRTVMKNAVAPSSSPVPTQSIFRSWGREKVSRQVRGL